MRKEFKNTAGEIESCDEIVKTKWGKFMAIRQGNLWGLVNEDYEEILPVCYEEVSPFPNGCIGVKKGKWKLFNVRGEQINLCEYDDVDGEFYGDYVRVELGRKMGLVYKNGEIVVPCKYDDIGTCPGEYIVVCHGGKWGIVNEEGDEVVPCVYDSAVKVKEHPEEGYAEFEIDGKMCRIYDKGEMYWD